MSKSVYEEYAELLGMISKLEEKKESLQVAIMNELDDEGTKEKKTELGGFYIMGRTTYEYSPKIRVMADNLKAEKKIEEASGTAVVKSSTRHVRFVRGKDE